ncbi:hypothetical protein B5S28_g3007 [[Candida] boidinii]|nr:hypothetical protein B5S28_g3007 [[Candida] boidinii]OWB62217.1 hypothetical protein B5S29_g3139 [[Candida] boidinii]OWB70691.1 hypothetical protein B5S31_g370 [[Candida] boidinii]OWB76262.1 hypothetical protein B5S32_g412 [[Candida] boidinii]
MPSEAELKTAKDSLQLVASLFELSKAATDLSNATVNFFKLVGTEGADPELLRSITKATSNIKASAEVHDVEDEKKKKKKVKDPNAPKKPLTSFFLFNNAIREDIQRERATTGLPALSQPEVAQETSRRWKELTKEEKDKWKELYEERKVIYEEENRKYQLSKQTGAPYTPPKGDEFPPRPSGIFGGKISKKSKKRDAPDGDDFDKKKDKKKKSKKIE